MQSTCFLGCRTWKPRKSIDPKKHHEYPEKRRKTSYDRKKERKTSNGKISVYIAISKPCMRSNATIFCYQICFKKGNFF